MRVNSDISGTAVRAVFELQQGIVWYSVEYYSKRLNNTKLRYSAIEHEILGYILPMEH